MPDEQRNKPVLSEDIGPRTMTLDDFARKYGRSLGFTMVLGFVNDRQRLNLLTGQERDLLAEYDRFSQRQV